MTPLNEREAAFPRLRITEAELMALPEYSCSMPTGTTIGKRWRREEPYRYDEPGPRRVWVGEYYDIGRADAVGVRWYRPVLQVTAILDEPRPWWLFVRTDTLAGYLLAEALEGAEQ